MRQRIGRGRLSYANVVATLALFIALGGGAIAASNLGKNSVGTRQLKKSSVTKAKIKKNAVTKAKIKNGAVNGSKIADGSVTGAEIDAASTPFSRIVFEARGNSTVSIPKTGFATYPLDSNSYTQEASRDDTYLGALDVTFKPTCTPQRSAQAFVVVDPQDPANPSEADVAAIGVAQDQGTGEVSKRINLGPYAGARFQNDAPTNHSILLRAAGLQHGRRGDGHVRRHRRDRHEVAIRSRRCGGRAAVRPSLLDSVVSQ